MRLLIATSHRAVVGGVETYLRAVLPLLKSAGFELGLYCSNPERHGPAIDDACPELPCFDTLPSAIRWKPELAYMHGLPDPVIEQQLAENVPTVYYAHNYAGLCISGTKCFRTFNSEMPCARSFGPACLLRYFPYGCGGNNPRTALRLYRTERLRQSGFAKFQSILANSTHIANVLIRNGAPVERVHVVPLFPPEFQRDPEPPASRPFTNTVLFVGRLTPLKGLHQVLEAMPLAMKLLNRTLRIVVVGDGPERPVLESHVKNAPFPVEFRGRCSRTEVEAEMREADVLAVPSVWPEPFGLVGIEAGCVGLPAAAYAVGGIPDWLKPGENGELAPGEHPDPRQLAAALVRLLKDHGHHQQLRTGAWQIAGRFTADEHLTKLLNLLSRSCCVH